MAEQARAQLRFTDDTGTGFIQVDCIPSLENTLSSTVTEFPLEDGSVAGEHIIHHPEMLKLEIAQTQIPFEDFDDDGQPIEFVKTSVPIELPKTRFRPKGLLFLLVQAEGALAAVGGAITGALGLGGSSSGALAIEVFRPPYEGKDRINDLFEKLRSARLRGAAMRLDWLGRSWDNYYIEQIVYQRTRGAQKGVFQLSLKQVVTVSTGTAKLPTPAEARLKAGLNGGNRPGKKTGAAEAAATKSAVSQSVLTSLTGFGA